MNLVCIKVVIMFPFLRRFIVNVVFIIRPKHFFSVCTTYDYIKLRNLLEYEKIVLIEIRMLMSLLVISELKIVTGRVYFSQNKI